MIFLLKCPRAVICHEQIYRLPLLLSPIKDQTTKLNYHENETNHDFEIVSKKPVAKGEQAVSSCGFAEFHLNASDCDYQFFCKLR